MKKQPESSAVTLRFFQDATLEVVSHYMKSHGEKESTEEHFVKGEKIDVEIYEKDSLYDANPDFYNVQFGNGSVARIPKPLVVLSKERPMKEFEVTVTETRTDTITLTVEVPVASKAKMRKEARQLAIELAHDTDSMYWKKEENGNYQVRNIKEV